MQKLGVVPSMVSAIGGTTHPIVSGPHGREDTHYEKASTGEFQHNQSTHFHNTVVVTNNKPIPRKTTTKTALPTLALLVNITW